MPLSHLPQLLAVARGDTPADLLLQNARIVNVFSGMIESADIAIYADRIAGVGSGYTARRTVDLKNAFVSPGLIDAHVHIESSLCIPSQFAAAVVPRGVTTVVADPHEIANVVGLPGIRYMAEDCRSLDLRVIMMAPSCVPATSMSTSGAMLSAVDLATLLKDGTVHGLAEMMNFPGVIQANRNVLAKLKTFYDHPIDGHCPATKGKDLNAYISAGIGSDHECVTVAEAQEKLSRGLYILIREASNAHNLKALLPLITPANNRRICLCTDDRQPSDLLDQGSVDHMLREVISAGVDPIDAFRLCTLNPCEWFGLHDRGAIAPGRYADLMIFDDLKKPTAREVYVAGKVASHRGHAVPTMALPGLTHSFHRDVSTIDWRIPAAGKRIRVIGSLPNQLVTESRIVDAKIDGKYAVADVSRDLLKIAVINRHGGSTIGLGFIQGIGLKSGAIAGTVAHDHHNLVVIGCDDRSMATAAKAVAQTQGGLAVASNDQTLATVPLPVAGLMSDKPITAMRDAYAALLAAATSLGSTLHDPFMAMSFMALEVIPDLKLTDQGLIDVTTFHAVELFV